MIHSSAPAAAPEFWLLNSSCEERMLTLPAKTNMQLQLKKILILEEGRDSL
ncbi:hypothetical protein [Lewinella sp. 4G2]|uniref:hypothetical protein n=1 Tax=Lewinella sp. 4G2 TaxID=1803372 RepID=UPI0012F80FAD|nr:hypothetical protein [Lewinella sp. 4G2]